MLLSPSSSPPPSTASAAVIARSLYRSLRRILASLETTSRSSRSNDDDDDDEKSMAAARQALILSRSGRGDGPPPLMKRQPRLQQEQLKPQGNQYQRKALVNKLWRTCLKQAMPRGACFCFPSQILSRNSSKVQSPSPLSQTVLQTLSLLTLLQAEFRASTRQITAETSVDVRQDLAFYALRILNTKQAGLDALLFSSSYKLQEQHPQSLFSPDDDSRIISPAPHVNVLPRYPPAAYLQPGTFLVAHPLRTGYFARTVICILDHQDEDNTLDSLQNNTGHPGRQRLGTMGLVVNRSMHNPRGDPDHGPGPTTLQKAVKPLDNQWVKQAFGNTIVREGGPAYSALQIMHAAAIQDSSGRQERAEDAIGGTVLPRACWPPPKDYFNGTIHSEEDRAPTRDCTKRKDGNNSDAMGDIVIKFQGDMTEAAKAVLNNKKQLVDNVENDNAANKEEEAVAIFMGATSWSVGHLQVEVEKGLWLPTAAPPSYALRGIPSSTSSTCVSHDSTKIKDNSNNWHDDFYLRMLAACGPGEAKLAQMIQNRSHHDSIDSSSKSLWIPCDEME